MNDFWLWFWRPIAEVLGGLFLFAIVIGVLMALILIDNWFTKRKLRRSAVKGE